MCIRDSNIVVCKKLLVETNLASCVLRDFLAFNCPSLKTLPYVLCKEQETAQSSEILQKTLDKFTVHEKRGLKMFSTFQNC